VSVRRDFLLGNAGAKPQASGEPPAAAAPAAGSSAAPDARIERIGIERARFTWITDAGPLDVSIALSAEGVTAREGETFPLHLELGIEDGTVVLDGRLGAAPPSFVGKLSWEEMPFPPLTLAARPELAGWVRSCRASGALDVDAHLAAREGREAGVRASGQMRVDDLDLGDPERKEVGVAWKSLEIDLREARIPLAAEGAPPAPMYVELARVALREPKLFYVAPAPTLARLTGGEPASEPPSDAAGPAGESAGEPAPAPAESPAEPAPAGAPLELVLDRFELSGLSARYEDLAREKPLRAVIENLGVELDGLRVRASGGEPEVAIASVSVRGAELSAEDEGVSPPYRGHVRDLVLTAHALRLPKLAVGDLLVTGKVAEGGAFRAQGTLRDGAGDGRFELRRLALAPYNPYASSAAGYRLQGATTLETKARVRGARYDVDNEIVLHDLALSEEKSGDFAARFGIPVDLALALLRDPSGEIRLGLPLVIDEKGARADVGAIVAGALRQALVGALSSPLKLVGASLSAATGGVGFDPLASAPGAPALAPGQDERLGAMAQMLAERPALALRLRGRAGPADRAHLAERILVERATAGEDLPSVEGVGFLARQRLKGALVDRGRGEQGELDAEDAAALARWIEATDVPPERFAALARSRAESARDALVQAHAVDPARLALAEPAPEGEPGVVVELGAK
jgi:hypothetical protein